MSSCSSGSSRSSSISSCSSGSSRSSNSSSSSSGSRSTAIPHPSSSSISQVGDPSSNIGSDPITVELSNINAPTDVIINVLDDNNTVDIIPNSTIDIANSETQSNVQTSNVQNTNNIQPVIKESIVIVDSDISNNKINVDISGNILA